MWWTHVPRRRRARRRLVLRRKLPEVLLLMFILVRWKRDEARGRASSDRAAALAGIPELAAYNGACSGRRTLYTGLRFSLEA